MRIEIGLASVSKVRRVIARDGLSQDESRALDITLAVTTKVWVGTYDDKIVCAFGMAPPTMLSSEGHLWLHTTERLKGHEFIFIRYSQRVIEMLLGEYDTITGITDPKKPGASRWLRWLGAEFDEPICGMVPFRIRKKKWIQ